ncbi:60S ribosomal protein L28 [Plasmodium gaboni]|uniref:60S ribosomal protein L28 n=2 Tax=Plasmodium gaboni TaxID=647221 RepID=A0ABY1UT38_9APIC|nr:60S ribosomal protein L28 [Plasmodium gaboni]
MSNVSNALVWELTRKSNCFIKKNKAGKKGVFLCDPLNVNYKNTPSSSGLVKSNSTNVTLKDGKVVFSVKTSNEANVVNQHFRAKNMKNVEKLLQQHGNFEKAKNKEKLLKKYKRLSKLYQASHKTTN